MLPHDLLVPRLSSGLGVTPSCVHHTFQFFIFPISVEPPPPPPAPEMGIPIFRTPMVSFTKKAEVADRRELER
jgi:hypothetical protein